MGYNSHYFVDKTARAEQAIKHTRAVDIEFKNQTKFSVERTKWYKPESTFSISTEHREIPTEIIIDPIGTVEAIHQYLHPEEKMAALNFASHKNPGGMFMNGSKAQEECLCHESNLYNVLCHFEGSYYKFNNQNKNKALYVNSALYTPNIVFMGDIDRPMSLKCHETPCDIITCAAPNYRTASRYQGVQREENLEACRSRVKFILNIAYDNTVDTLILGAFGCGVFGQDPCDMAIIFKEYLLTLFRDKFKRVVFAIPPSNGHENNLNYFRKVFGNTAYNV